MVLALFLSPQNQDSGHLHTYKECLPRLFFFLTENKKVLEDKCNALRSVKTTKEAKVKQLKQKAHNLEESYEQRKVAAEEKLKRTHCELTAKKNQLVAAGPLADPEAGVTPKTATNTDYQNCREAQDAQALPPSLWASLVSTWHFSVASLEANHA
ncbi:uncharacterized protein LOC144222548 [Crocuta crocuta]